MKFLRFWARPQTTEYASRDVKVSRPLFWSRSWSHGNWFWSQPRSGEVLVSGLIRVGLVVSKQSLLSLLIHVTRNTGSNYYRWTSYLLIILNAKSNSYRSRSWSRSFWSRSHNRFLVSVSVSQSPVSVLALVSLCSGLINKPVSKCFIYSKLMITVSN